MRLETNLVLTSAGNPWTPWEIILKKHRVIFYFMHIIYHTLGCAENSEKNLRYIIDWDKYAT